MALSGWNAQKRLTAKIPAQSETLTDFPVLLNLTTASGVTGYDCSAIFREISPISTDDPYWSDVVLAMPMDGANNSTTFTDLKGKTVTAAGNAKISTTQSKFGGAAAYFDGNGDYLSVPYSSDVDLSTETFTVEGWIYPTNVAGSGRRIVATGGGVSGWNGTTGIHFLIQVLSTSRISVQFWNGASSSNYETAASISINTWNFISVSITGTSLCVGINGAVETSTIATRVRPTSNPTLGIGTIPGENGDPAAAYTGYIDDLRITKGVARYTANFTPPGTSFHHTGLVTPKKFAIEYGDTGKQCHVEIERWDAINRSAQLWVRVPQVLTQETKLNIFYDSAHADNTSVTTSAASDNFTGADGDQPSRFLWRTNPTESHVINSNKLRLTTNSAVYLNHSASGDFDVQIDFSLVTYPSTNAWGLHLIVGLVSSNGNDTMTLFRGYQSGTQRYQSAQVIGGAWTLNTVVDTSDTTGKLRITRSNTTVTYYYWNGASWSSIGTYTWVTGDVFFYINHASWTGNPTAVVDVDNLTINSAGALSGYIGDTGSWPAKCVWNLNYLAVYNLSQDPSTTVKDSTQNNRNLTPSGSMTIAQLVAGPVGKALAFDGVNDVMTSSASDLSALQTAFTTEAVAKFIAPGATDRLFTIGSEATGQIILGRSGSTGYLMNGVWGDGADSGVALDSSNFKSYGQLLSAGTLRAVGNGAIDAITNTVTIQTLTSSVITLTKFSTAYYQHQIRSIRISKIARSAAWLAASYNSDFDQLVTFTVNELARMQVDLPYCYVNSLLASVDLPYMSKPTLKAIIDLPYASRNRPRAQVDLPYTHRPTAKAVTELVYGSMTQVRVQVDLPYKFGAALVRAETELVYAITDRIMVRAQTDLPYWGEASTALVAVSSTCTVAGVAVEPLDMDLTWSRDQYALSASITLATGSDYALAQVGAAVVLTLHGTDYHLQVESRQRHRSHGEWSYTAACLSPAAWLDAPYAPTINGAQTGPASVIASNLAGSIPLSWETVDWTLNAGDLFATAQTPLALIRQLAAAPGGILLSQPDGSLVVEPAYPVPVNRWSQSTPAAVIRESMDVISASETDDYRPGYNVYLITDQVTTADTLRIETEAESDLVSLLRVYQTPWADDFNFRHTGGNWVQLHDLGIEQRQVSEVVEFVAGEGRVQYPIYSLDAAAWQQVNLGAVSFVEAGALTAAIEGESLLALTYTTRCRRYRARDSRSEQVQFIAEVTA